MTKQIIMGSKKGVKVDIWGPRISPLETIFLLQLMEHCLPFSIHNHIYIYIYIRIYIFIIIKSYSFQHTYNKQDYLNELGHISNVILYKLINSFKHVLKLTLKNIYEVFNFFFYL